MQTILSMWTMHKTISDGEKSAVHPDSLIYEACQNN